MKTRIISSVAMLPLLLLVYAGGLPLYAACLIMGAMGAAEMFGSFRKAGIKPSRAVGAASLAMLYGANAAEPLIPWIGGGRLYMLWLTAVVSMSFIYMLNVNGRRLEDGTATVACVLYSCFLPFHVLLLDQMDGGRAFIWLVFISAFGTDVMAYFTGMAFGRRKLCPDVSPKKTVEGAVGGLLGSVALCGAYGLAFAPGLVLHCAAIGALGGVAAQLGDLSASAVKRKLGVKDFGALIPGHGGLLDRFDSVMFTAPLVYYYAAFASAPL
jgi:phosphatidate cytidylyltransferase